MRIKRALFRLWLVVSVCWAILILVASNGDNRLQVIAGAALVPPIVALALGMALVWAVGGFDRRA